MHNFMHESVKKSLQHYLRSKLLLDCKTLCLQITIVPTAFCRETQNTVVRISNTALVKHRVAFSPNHMYRDTYIPRYPQFGVSSIAN